ncbi:alpha/beta hydrolase [Kaarinaea lacus]
MGRFKRRTKFILVTIALLLVVTGGWLYKTVYLSTGSALSRAEGFLFSRMTVAQLGEQGAMRYFYVTNRAMTEEADELRYRFGAERGSELKFGFFDTKVEPSVGLGMFINPSEWFQNEEIKIKKMDELQQQELVAQVKNLVEASPHRSLLVVVHGFREAFPSALRKTAFLGHVLDINSPILLFDWPGNQGSSLRGYRRARNVAIESGADLAKTLELIVREINPEKLWIIGNSMGGQVIADAFSHLYQNPEFADTGYEFEDVIMTAPDVSQEEFDNQFKQEITSMARNLTVYVSSNDRALVMSRIVNRDPRRGESTLSPDMLEEAVRISALLEPGEDLIDLVDVTPVNRTRNFHNFSLETPEFFDDLYLRLTNEKNPNSGLIYRFQTKDGANYWVLTPGR